MPSLRVVMIASLVACSRTSRESQKDPDADVSSMARDVDANAAPAVPTVETDAGASLVARLDGNEVGFRFGGAHASSGGLLIILSNRAMPCEVNRAEGAYQIELSLPPGPGGGFFAGQQTGVNLSLYFDQRIHDALGGEASVRLAPFHLEKGARVMGTLDFRSKSGSAEPKLSWARGAFDVVLCDGREGFAKQPQLPTMAKSGPLQGEFEGRPFQFKKGLARVSHDPSNDFDVLTEIDLYATTQVSCDHRGDPEHGHFHLRDVGGANSRYKLTGTPQPAMPAYLAPGETISLTWFGGTAGAHGAWVQLDALDFTPGATIRGIAYAKSAPDAPPGERGTFSGRFDAIVCPLPP